MKFQNTLRLEFEHVFPDEEPKEVIDYLKLVSREILLSIIGFCNTYPQPNFDNFSSNYDIRRNIIDRVIKYCSQNRIKNKPGLVSRESSLKLAEIILSNKELLLDNNRNSKNVDEDEINLFKSFLIINKEINEKQILKTSDDIENRESLAQMIIAMSFSTSDVGGGFEDNTFEFGKVVFCAIERFEKLIDFLNSNSDYDYLKENLCIYFNVESIKDLLKHVKYLFSQLLQLKTKNGYKFSVVDKESITFLNSLISNNVGVDDDFTNLRNYPLYKIDDDTYSVIDHFFVVDKFYKSVRFILKEAFNKKHGLSDKDRKFFEFFNTKFSEEFLMKSVLDKVFDKNYFIKKNGGKDKSHEPDYYVRHNNCIFLFESKDVLIRKDVKSSGDIEKILDVFKDKFLKNKENGKPIGIGQLINSISQIVENTFDFDNYVNTKKNFTIYPILLINDRILEIPGVNYILNQWYLDLVKEKLKEKYNPHFIKNLTIIDIDTIIFGTNYFVKRDNNFRDFIENHLKELNTVRKPYGKTIEEVEESVNKNLLKQISPISYRFPKEEFSMNLFIEKLKI